MQVNTFTTTLNGTLRITSLIIQSSTSLRSQRTCISLEKESKLEAKTELLIHILLKMIY